MRHASFVFIPAVLLGCQSVPTTDTVKSEVNLATQSWAAAFDSCDANKAAMLYGADAVFWGTSAPTIISSPTGVRQYFERVCSASVPPKVAFGEQLIRTYGNTAINSGSYTFTLFPGGQARAFPARYSFTYQMRDGQWLIVDHHSSALPTPPIPAPAPTR
jgi:uncharacterized protein (TIGR02246 family)